MNKYRIAYLVTVAVWFLFVVALLIHGRPRTETEVSEPQPQPDPPAVVRVIPKPIVATVANTDAEAVPMERDPVRDDIPLSAENQRLLWQACEETGVTYELALAVIWKETNFRNIKGDGGDSVGYMQVQPRWHSDRMKKLGVTDLTDPYSNFLVGCDYLAELASKDRGIEWVLHAYNGGMSYANKLAKAGKVSQYAKNALNYMNILTMEEI
ncbi:MAG: lytic transglycosylase domain-containing protein [Bacteroidaceae bacterium]|nr:lytic transglycosylase domain-containing protein [Bacteroidaceae bacterium]